MRFHRRVKVAAAQPGFQVGAPVGQDSSCASGREVIVDGSGFVGFGIGAGGHGVEFLEHLECSLFRRGIGKPVYVCASRPPTSAITSRPNRCSRPSSASAAGDGIADVGLELARLDAAQHGDAHGRYVQVAASHDAVERVPLVAVIALQVEGSRAL